MTTFTGILKPDADGTLHLPVPEELRQGEVVVTATLRGANDTTVTSDKIGERRRALQELRDAGGLSDIIPDPVAWQREQRRDRPLPDRD